MALQDIDAIADRDEYLVKRRRDLIQKLRMLKNEKVTVSAYFGSGKHFVLTLVLEVLPEKNLLILDYGPNEAANKKLLAAERGNFITRCQGIQVQFSVRGITKARFKGMPVYAVPIPDALLWLQRRQSYRMKMPLEHPARCQLSLNDAESIEMRVLDISATGIALMDESCSLTEDKRKDGEIIHSKLMLPGFGELKADIEIRNRRLVDKDEASKGQHIGCRFVDLSYAEESHIQQYILSEERRFRHIPKT